MSEFSLGDVAIVNYNSELSYKKNLSSQKKERNGRACVILNKKTVPNMSNSFGDFDEDKTRYEIMVGLEKIWIDEENLQKV